MGKINPIIIFLLQIAFVVQSCSSDYTEKLGGGYFYRDEGKDIKDILCERSNNIESPATVINYSFNNDFIIAKQKPKLPQDPLYKKDYIYKNGISTFYYWIIIKRNDIILGPLDYQSYDREMINRNIPKYLRLK